VIPDARQHLSGIPSNAGANSSFGSRDITVTIIVLATIVRRPV